jgi:hypothetical protein
MRFPIDEGSSTRLEHPMRSNLGRVMRFPIDEGSFNRLEQPCISKLLILVAFPIEEGSSIKLEQSERTISRRLMAVERLGSSFK